MTDLRSPDEDERLARIMDEEADWLASGHFPLTPEARAAKVADYRAIASRLRSPRNTALSRDEYAALRAASTHFHATVEHFISGVNTRAIAMVLRTVLARYAAPESPVVSDSGMRPQEEKAAKRDRQALFQEAFERETIVPESPVVASPKEHTALSDVQGIADVLAKLQEHREDWLGGECSCGAKNPAGIKDTLEGDKAWWEAHLASVLSESLAPKDQGAIQDEGVEMVAHGADEIGAYMEGRLLVDGLDTYTKEQIAEIDGPFTDNAVLQILCRVFDDGAMGEPALEEWFAWYKPADWMNPWRALGAFIRTRIKEGHWPERTASPESPVSVGESLDAPKEEK